MSAAQVQRWLQEVVVGLGLCPFAGPVLDAGLIRTMISEAQDGPGAVKDALTEAVRLLETPESEIATTLVVVPHALADFETFLDATETLVVALSEGGADGLLQVATFHPDYRFAGEAEDALSHYTNRAPFPIFHLLRESQVSEAVASHPDPEGIPARNIACLEALGPEGVAALWARIEGEGQGA